jgi:hypothetical protein
VLVRLRLIMRDTLAFSILQAATDVPAMYLTPFKTSHPPTTRVVSRGCTETRTAPTEATGLTDGAKFDMLMQFLTVDVINIETDIFIAKDHLSLVEHWRAISVEHQNLARVTVELVGIDSWQFPCLPTFRWVFPFYSLE